MIHAPSRLFHTLVGSGAALVLGCAASPDRAEDDGPTSRRPENAGGSASAPESLSPDAPDGDPDGPASGSDPVPDMGEGGAPDSHECAGEGIECTSNGVMCCWANDPGCESCCPGI